MAYRVSLASPAEKDAYTAYEPIFAATPAHAEPIDPIDISARLRQALHQAEAFVTRMPTAQMGLLFIRDGEVTQPDPDHLESYEPHAGQRRGYWPTNPEITAAMFKRFYDNRQ